MIVIGIDPGLDGAIAAVAADSLTTGTYLVEDMPTVLLGKTGRRMVAVQVLADLFWRLVDAGAERPHVVIENVHAMPRQGVASMFSMGRTLGAIEGVAGALKSPIHYVEPRAWKRYYNIGSDKEESRAVALQRFPGLAAALARKKDHGRAEALLITRYWLERGASL